MSNLSKMKEDFTYFIGIDISKSKFDLALHFHSKPVQFPNTKTGWKAMYKQFKKELPHALVILEKTGGYELGLLDFLAKHDIAIHCANTRKVKFFIRSYGKLAKTDAIDATYLAAYGFERQSSLTLFVAPDSTLVQLKALVSRAQDIKQMLVQEKNRAQTPFISPIIQKSVLAIIKAFQDQLSLIQAQIDAVIESNQALQHKISIIQSVPGIGKTIAPILIAQLPELGLLSRRQIASLAGLAPHPKDSGSYSGYRSTAYGGKRSLKPTLHMASLAAACSHSNLAEFYNSLIARGKKPMLALTALQRKMIVIANARLRDSVLLP